MFSGVKWPEGIPEKVRGWTDVCLRRKHTRQQILLEASRQTLRRCNPDSGPPAFYLCAIAQMMESLEPLEVKAWPLEFMLYEVADGKAQDAGNLIYMSRDIEARAKLEVAEGRRSTDFLQTISWFTSLLKLFSTQLGAATGEITNVEELYKCIDKNMESKPASGTFRGSSGTFDLEACHDKVEQALRNFANSVTKKAWKTVEGTKAIPLPSKEKLAEETKEFQAAAPRKWLLEAAKDIMDAGLTGNSSSAAPPSASKGGQSLKRPLQADPKPAVRRRQRAKGLRVEGAEAAVDID